MKHFSKLCFLIALSLPTVGSAQTLFVFSGTNGLAVAASRADLDSYDLGTPGIGGAEHPDRIRWQIATGLPRPAVWPSVVDPETGIGVAVRGTNIDAAISTLADAVSNATPQRVHAARANVQTLAGTNAPAAYRATLADRLKAATTQAQQIAALREAVAMLIAQDELRDVQNERRSGRGKVATAADLKPGK